MYGLKATVQTIKLITNLNWLFNYTLCYSQLFKHKKMNIFKEAKQKELEGMGYRARRFKIIWKSKTVSWNWLAIEWGIRWSDKWQLFPIWNGSHNGQRSLIFGLWKLYFQIIWHRKKSFNQNRKLFLRKPLWKFYQLVS